LLVHLLRLLLPTLAVVVALGAVGIDLTALAVFSGAIGIGIGLGLQQLAANVIAGFVLILDKSIKPGDVISIGETFGRVTSLGARYVSMRTRDGIEYLIPNNHFMNSGVENWSYSDVNVRLKVQVGVAYETDLHQAIALCIEAAKAVPRVLEQPRPICLVTGFGESAITLEIRLWINDPSDGVANVRSAVWLEVWDRFKQAGIRIPFPQRDVHIIR
jgi:small-conductance mechanosensitive channel